MTLGRMPEKVKNASKHKQGLKKEAFYRHSDMTTAINTWTHSLFLIMVPPEGILSPHFLLEVASQVKDLKLTAKR